MQYMKLGNSDLRVSRICMGCMGFGDSARGQHTWTVDEEESHKMIKRGLEFLAWLLQKVTAPVVGATKLQHIEEAVKAVELVLSESEMAYLEEAYVPHRLVGVMAQNTDTTAQMKIQNSWVDFLYPKNPIQSVKG